MQRKCEAKGCRQDTPDRTYRYCPRHALAVLKRIRRESPGYFQPLQYRTPEGRVRLSSRPWLVLEETEEMLTSPLQASCEGC